MISQHSKEAVKEAADLLSELQRVGVEMKKKGTHYEGCCPFHNEKTPSFKVKAEEPSAYKCFGCGESGDVISLLMKVEGLEFSEAMVQLAERYGVELEYDNKRDARQEKETMDRKRRLIGACTAAADYWHHCLLNMPEDHPDYAYIHQRFTAQQITDWKIGYNQAHVQRWDHTYQKLRKLGFEPGEQVSADVTKKSENGKHYDAFRGRITIPITDASGNIVAFTARITDQGDQQQAKYLNSRETDIFKKDRIIFGLHKAKPEIRAADGAVWCEGQIDVIAAQTHGIGNAVAGQGSSISEHQTRALRKFGKKLVICTDGDDPGKRAADRIADEAVQGGLLPFVVQLPEGQDPDSLGAELETLIGKAKDWILETARNLPRSTPNDKASAKQHMVRILSYVDEMVRDEYAELVVNIIKARMRDVKAGIKDLIEKRNNNGKGERSVALPKGADDEAEEDFKHYGFFAHQGRYMVAVSSKEEEMTFKPISNFTMKVLYHIQDKFDAKRVVEIRNIHGVKKTVDVSTDSLTTLGEFKKFVEGQGNFLFYGQAPHYEKLKLKLFDQERSCVQLNTMGYVVDGGFFAFNNGIYDGKEWRPTDENGIVRYGEYHWYIPSANHSYANDRSAFLNEKKFYHQPAEGLTFQRWADQFVRVYGDSGKMALVFGCACLHSHHIFKCSNGFPMMFLYGEASSGKGSLIQSLQHLWGEPQDATALGASNSYKGFIRQFAKFVNALMLLEEYNERIKPETIEVLKNLWDRYGYKRAEKDNSFNTNTVPVNSGVMITGNHYPNQDDALLTRLIVLEMHNSTFDESARENYQALKDMQEQGITNATLELLQYGDIIKQHYYTLYKEESKRLSDHFKGTQMADRMIRNLAVLTATFRSLHEKGRLGFPFQYDDLLRCLTDAMGEQVQKRNAGDEIAGFFDCLRYAIQDGRLMHNHHYRIDGNEFVLHFKACHMAYLKAYRELHSGTGLGAQTMISKLKRAVEFEKTRSSYRFGGQRRSSGMEFRLDALERYDFVAASEVGEQVVRRRMGDQLESGHIHDLPAKDLNPSVAGSDEEVGDMPF